MAYATYRCEKCGVDLLMGRPVKVWGDLGEIQLCAGCQRALDRLLDTHPTKVEDVEATAAMVSYWLAQAHWRDVKEQYVQEVRTYRHTRQALLQIVQQWLAGGG